MSKPIEKKAMSEADKAIFMKYLKAALGAGTLAAGAGVVMSRLKAKKDKKDLTDLGKARNVIIVPVKKESFMSGLPTPDDFAKTFAASSRPGAATPSAEMSAEDIESKKKAVLNGRKVDFFGKAASVKKAEDNATKEGGKSDKKDGEGAVLRDVNGRFANTTDPVSVAHEEKSAEGFLDMITHPDRTGKAMFSAGVVRPLAFTAGGLASVYLAAKLVEAVNNVRKSRSNEDVENAREEYVKLLEGGEKSAQAAGDNMAYTALTTLGGAFMLPAALSAVIVNKIMEKRKADAKKKSLQSDSYPDEPLILYKTSEDKEIAISAETALSAILVKRAMIVGAERIDRSGIEKDAFLGFNSASQDDIVNGAVDALGMPENSGNLLNLTKAYVSGDDDAVNSAIGAIKSTASEGMGAWDKFKTWWKTPSNAYNSPAFKDKLMSSGRFQDMMIGKFRDDDAFKSYGNQMIDDYIGRTFKKDGWLFNILSSLAKNTSFGQGMVEDRIRKMFPVAQTDQPAKA